MPRNGTADVTTIIFPPLANFIEGIAAPTRR